MFDSEILWIGRGLLTRNLKLKCLVEAQLGEQLTSVLRWTGVNLHRPEHWSPASMAFSPVVTENFGSGEVIFALDVSLTFCSKQFENF